MSNRREGISPSEKVSSLRFQNEIDLNSPIADAARRAQSEALDNRRIHRAVTSKQIIRMRYIGLFNSNIGSYSSPHTQGVAVMPNSSLRRNITQIRSRGYLRAYISLVSRGGLDFQDVDAQQTGDK
jgi:hypothetical protein